MIAGWLLPGIAITALAADAASPHSLTLSVSRETCLYTLGPTGGPATVAKAGVAAKVNGNWFRPSAYPKCAVVECDVLGDLGPAHQWVVEYQGLKDEPDLGYTIRSYLEKPFVDIQGSVVNRTGQSIEVEAIRSMEAPHGIDLAGPLSMIRVLSDSFSEDRPAMRIRELGDAENGMHCGVGTQLIYNRQTQRSFFVGAVTSDRISKPRGDLLEFRTSPANLPFLSS